MDEFLAAAKLEPRAMRLSSRIAGAESTVAIWGGAGPFEFKAPVPGDFHRADVWFDDVRIPESFSYRAEVFIHPVDRKWKAADSVGSLTVWKGHVTLDGKKHLATANMFIPVTEKLRAIIAANPKQELAATVVVTPITPAARPRATVKPIMRAVEDEVQFKSVRLILDGDGPFKTPLNPKGNHGH